MNDSVKGWWLGVAALPLTLPVALSAWPPGAVGAPAWFGFGHVSIFSMGVGLFAWYRGLALAEG